MPISKDRKHHYQTEAWKIVSEIVRLRADGKCEICGTANGTYINDPALGGPLVVLTVMHLDHNPPNISLSNLAHACQQCHNGFDAPVRAENRRREIRKLVEKSQLSLPGLESGEIRPAGNEISTRQLYMYQIYQGAVERANSALNQEYARHSNP